MHRVYLLVWHDYDGYTVLHVFSDITNAKRKMQEYIDTARAKVLANPKGYSEWTLDPSATFSYEVLEFPLE